MVLLAHIQTRTCSFLMHRHKHTRRCFSQWCWVVRENCRNPFSTSTYFPSVTVGSQSEDGAPVVSPLAYSYSTCGYLNLHELTASSQVRVLKQYAADRPSGRIRVSFPGDSGSMYSYIPCAA